MSYQKHLNKDKVLATLVKEKPYILKKRKNNDNSINYYLELLEMLFKFVKF